jgi:cytochrome c peroxidase
MRQWLIVCLVMSLSVLVSDIQAGPSAQFDEREVRILRSLSLESLGSPPDNPSNRVADSKRAVGFGRQLFFDESLSIDGTLSCAGCHKTDRAYTDGLALAEGVERTARNTPTLFGVAFQNWFYWDGRRDSLWSQALIPFEAPSEMASSRVAVVRAVLTNPEYRAQYQALFGEPPDFDWAALPQQATPLGVSARQNAWYRLPRATQQLINEVFSNVGKALEAFQRTLDPPKTRFDQFVSALLEGKADKVRELASPREIRGMRLFIDGERGQCLRCHNGPMLSNGGFHNIGTGKFSGQNMDFGRVFGLQAVVIDEFNCLGKYSDARPDQCETLNHLSQDPHQILYGAFKTPTLRYLDQTGPYFHDGRFESLQAVVDYYAEPPIKGRNQAHELMPLDLAADERDALVAFLKMLSRDTESQ